MQPTVRQGRHEPICARRRITDGEPLWHRAVSCLLERGLHRRGSAPASPFVLERVRRVLVVRKDNLGDLLCTTPALRALRRALPSAHIATLVADHCRPLLERNPDVDEVLGWTKGKHASGAFGTGLPGRISRLRSLQRQRYDLAITTHAPYNASAAWLAYASGAVWRLGWPPPAGERLRFFLNLFAEPPGRDMHVVDANLLLLAAIGVPPAGRALTLVPDPGRVEALRRRLAAEAPAAGQFALVHISSRREASRWPPSRFAEAAALLRDRLGVTILLSWAPGNAQNRLFPGDDGRAEEVAAQMPIRPILLATPELADLVAAVSLSRVVLSTDGGLMHIAAALDVPQTVLFGRTEPVYWAPVSDKAIILQRGGHVENIDVREVVDAAVRLVQAPGPEVQRGVRP